MKFVLTMIKYTIQEITDWVLSFSLLEIVTQKECFFCFIWILKVSLRLTLIQKEGLHPLRWLLLIRVLWLWPFRVYTREQLAKGRFFEVLQNYMQNKNEGNENKIMFRNLNCIKDKIDRGGENLKKAFIGLVKIHRE